MPAWSTVKCRLSSKPLRLSPFSCIFDPVCGGWFSCPASLGWRRVNARRRWRTRRATWPTSRCASSSIRVMHTDGHRMYSSGGISCAVAKFRTIPTILELKQGQKETSAVAVTCQVISGSCPGPVRVLSGSCPSDFRVGWHMAGACGYGSETGGVMADIRTLTVEKIRAYHKVRASCIGALYPSGVEERGEGGGGRGSSSGSFTCRRLSGDRYPSRLWPAFRVVHEVTRGSGAWPLGLGERLLGRY